MLKQINELLIAAAAAAAKSVPRMFQRRTDSVKEEPHTEYQLQQEVEQRLKTKLTNC